MSPKYDRKGKIEKNLFKEVMTTITRQTIPTIPDILTN